MIYSIYPQILGIMDKLNEWDEKLKNFADSQSNNLGTGVLIMGFLILIAVFGIRALNKK